MAVFVVYRIELPLSVVTVTRAENIQDANLGVSLST